MEHEYNMAETHVREHVEVYENDKNDETIQIGKLIRTNNPGRFEYPIMIIIYHFVLFGITHKLLQRQGVIVLR